jgi:hypothetical protein
MKTNLKANSVFIHRAITLVALVAIITFTSTRLRADSGSCRGSNFTVPFTDIAGSIFFCSIAEAYYSGLTNGTTPTTYSPTAPVPRDQMAAFITRTLDQSLRRGSERAAMEQWWMPQSILASAQTNVGFLPKMVKWDGADLWVANSGSDTVSRVRASDGKLLETWTGATDAEAVLVARGRIYVGGSNKLYALDPKQPAGNVSILGHFLAGINGLACDGIRVWAASENGIVSIFDPNTSIIVPVYTGFDNLSGPIFDGSNIWVTDFNAGKLLKLDSNGAVIQNVPIGGGAGFPIFDGTNIWVPNPIDNSVSVVRAASGQVLATQTGNGLNAPLRAAFDGERILITNYSDGVSLWKATDLTPLGSVSTGPDSFPEGACSDGRYFWITLSNTSKLARL